MRVYCISGKARHGKDTVGLCLFHSLKNVIPTEKGVLLTHNADLLKFICEKFFDWDGNKDERGRTLLQYVGTDIIREQEPDFWVNFLIHIAHLFKDSWSDIIIPDCRFPNEIQRWKDEGFDVVHIRVERPDCEDGLTEEQKQHSSENALNDYPVDYTIVNDGSIIDLANATLSTLVDVLKTLAVNGRITSPKIIEYLNKGKERHAC